jgi:hypothetical protein
METGSYTYAPPVPLTRALNEALTYTVQDNDGDTGASQLSLNVVLPSVAPIAVDLGSDGIAYRSMVPGVDFQLPSGLAPTAWVGAQDGLLAYDYSSDGVINQAKEFVFTMWGRNPEVTTDMQALGAYFDSNGDGLLSSLDGSWSQFGVWQDLNSDGVQQEGEFHALITWEIESIVLSCREGSTPYGAADGQVQVYGQMDVNYANGSTGLADDVAFAVSAAIKPISGVHSDPVTGLAACSQALEPTHPLACCSLAESVTSVRSGNSSTSNDTLAMLEQPFEILPPQWSGFNGCCSTNPNDALKAKRFNDQGLAADNLQTLIERQSNGTMVF